MKISVLLFAYNRPEYLRKALKTHKKIEGLNYYAFIDKSPKQKEILDIIHDSQIYDVIIPRQEHFGLNRNIREGIDWAFMNSDAVIVLEDDLLLSEDALSWLKENLHYIDAVSLQKEDPKYPFRCWGWGMWKSTWDCISWSFPPEISWDVVVNKNFRKNGWYCRCSKTSRVKHIGIKGTHYSILDLFSIRRLWHYIGTH
jgi:glycosyltransferase involved in cell wall biosynthesis